MASTYFWVYTIQCNTQYQSYPDSHPLPKYFLACPQSICANRKAWETNLILQLGCNPFSLLLTHQSSCAMLSAVPRYSSLSSSHLF